MGVRQAVAHQVAQFRTVPILTGPCRELGVQIQALVQSTLLGLSFPTPCVPPFSL